MLLLYNSVKKLFGNGNWSKILYITSKYICKYIKIVLSPNRILLIYNAVKKIFGNGNCPKFLYITSKYICKYMK
jgi:hypothetical protein